VLDVCIFFGLGVVGEEVNLKDCVPEFGTHATYVPQPNPNERMIYGLEKNKASICMSYL